jgi:hypothetical protein
MKMCLLCSIAGIREKARSQKWEGVKGRGGIAVSKKGSENEQEKHGG